MKILILGYPNSAIHTEFSKRAFDVFSREDKLSLTEIKEISPGWIISYGYRHIISPDILNTFPHRVINLHLSYLPWNRGAHPNFWSIYEGTPSGVTIHEIDPGLDTGPILVQRMVEFDWSRDTLQTSYDKLRQSIEELFIESWPAISEGRMVATPQKGSGSTHRKRELESIFGRLPRGWATSISELRLLRHNI